MATSIHSAVTDAVDQAIQFCIEKTTANNRLDVLAARERGDCSICQYLRYGLAKGIASFIGSTDGTTKAAYVYNDIDPDLTWKEGPADRTRSTPGIRLILWAEKKSPALTNLTDAIAEAVERESQNMACPYANALCHHLDVSIVDDHEVKTHSGIGALLGSPHTPPIEIWHR